MTPTPTPPALTQQELEEMKGRQKDAAMYLEDGDAITWDMEECIKKDLPRCIAEIERLHGRRRTTA